MAQPVVMAYQPASVNTEEEKQKERDIREARVLSVLAASNLVWALSKLSCCCGVTVISYKCSTCAKHNHNESLGL